MNNIAFFAAFALLLGAATVAIGGAEADNPPPATPGRSEQAKPRMPTKDSTGCRYIGAVTEVAKESITILWPGEEKPKTFAISETLASGGFPTKARLRFDGSQRTVLPSFRYRLSDVKIGDEVSITFAHLGESDICDEICIRKRPGGQVPPLPTGAEKLDPPVPNLPKGEVFLSMIPYHERMNAYWDLEDKGIPYPEKFGKYRQFPAAPMPRLARISSPAISQ